MDTKGQFQTEDSARAGSLRAETVETDFWEGAGEGIGRGLMRGGAKAAQFIGMAGATIPMTADAVMGDTQLQDWYFENVIDDFAGKSVDYWTPNPNEVGTAGRVLGGLAEIALPLAAGGGNPSLMIGSQSMGVGTELVRQGVDGSAAAKVAGVEAAAAGVGFVIPFFGKTLTQRIASGVAGNLAVNPAAEAVQQQVLIRSGDEEQAQWFDPLNAEARALDVLTGAVFGGVSHLSARRISRTDQNATATANNARHYQRDTMPGTPADIAASVAHQRAITEAIQQLTQGEPVSLSRAATEGVYRPAPPADLKPMAAAFREIYGEDLPPPGRGPVDPREPVARLPEPGPRVPVVQDVIDTPELQVARAAVADSPDLRVMDDEGLEVNARELLSRADEGVNRAQVDSKAYAAAVACFMRFGV